MVDYLEQSERLTKNDKESYRELLKRDMDEAEFYVSLRELSRLLAKHFDKKVIILIDEYDVPLAKAYENGYYDQMIFTMRNFSGTGIKNKQKSSVCGFNRMYEDFPGKHFYRSELIFRFCPYRM
mgnify:CR=1 FL=1